MFLLPVEFFLINDCFAKASLKFCKFKLYENYECETKRKLNILIVQNFLLTLPAMAHFAI